MIINNKMSKRRSLRSLMYWNGFKRYDDGRRYINENTGWDIELKGDYPPEIWITKPNELIGMRKTRLSGSLEIWSRKGNYCFSNEGYNDSIYQMIFSYMIFNFPDFNIPDWANK